MVLRWLLCALKARYWIKALFPSSQPAAWNELYLFQLKTFFFTSLFLVISLKDNVPECPCAFLLGIVIIFQLYPLLLLIPYFYVWICRTLQTVGPSHARTYTVAVYFKGERIGCGKGPRWVRQYNIIRHNRTRFSPSQCTANGLENNGCALLMVFIIAIKLLLAYSIGRDIMQNENESIHYRFDVNCVMEISLCAEESVTRQHCI